MNWFGEIHYITLIMYSNFEIQEFPLEKMMLKMADQGYKNFKIMTDIGKDQITVSIKFWKDRKN